MFYPQSVPPEHRLRNALIQLNHMCNIPIANHKTSLMLIPSLKALFKRDLAKLKTEINLYNSEAQLWHIEKSIANSGGNLCLHLIGNLKTYIGKELGGIAYECNRDAEFSLKNIRKAGLVEMIDQTIAAVEAGLDNVTEEQLQQEYPLLVLATKTTTGYFLIHLAMHLIYHLARLITTGVCWMNDECFWQQSWQKQAFPIRAEKPPNEPTDERIATQPAMP